MDALALYEEACSRDSALAGFYNRNVRVDGPTGPVLVRIPGPAVEKMDVCLWHEPAVLEAIHPHLASSPRLLHSQARPAFQIHEFVEGRRVDDLAPDGKPVPDAVVDGVVRFFASVLRVPKSVLPPVPDTWADDGDCQAFAGLLLDFVREIRGRGGDDIQGLYTALGIPADPCGPLAERAESDLTSRPFRLLHADIHRRNLILTEQGRLVVLDWELALWGDPVYDLADHLHKTAYTAADRRQVVDGWARYAPQACLTDWRQGVDFYLAYEAMKSAVVDTVRWGRRIAAADTPHERTVFAEELRLKLVSAAVYWGGGRIPEVAEIEDAAVSRLG